MSGFNHKDPAAMMPEQIKKHHYGTHNNADYGNNGDNYLGCRWFNHLVSPDESTLH
jgi:hypothetical protein